MKAFPNMTNQQGMDLRDYFATAALPVAFNMVKELHAFYDGEYAWDYDDDCGGIADVAYLFADAMMKAREQ